MKKVLILGINGFIGHTLARQIIDTTDWHMVGMDISTSRLGAVLGHPRLSFVEGSMMDNMAWVEQQIQACDVILPLVAIATPGTYVTAPLKVFELDFEANLPIVRMAAKYGKHLVFPSTSEVYGMCHDEEFDPDTSELICGPINKPRWIYSCSKQLMDRVIWGYGMEGLNFTLFRPFNWIGPGQDSIHTQQAGSARVVSQFLGHILRGETISLVDGGAQKRAFADIDDGISALMKIIANEGGVASGQIYNIGNPANNHSIRELADTLLQLAKDYPAFADGLARVQVVTASSDQYYGKGYQDMQNRVPKITNTCADLNWQPQVTFEDCLRNILADCQRQLSEPGPATQATPAN